MNSMIKRADQLHKQALALRERSDQLLRQAMGIYEKQTQMAVRKQEDKLLNRKQALELLWFDTYPSLRHWEKQVNPHGYLKFNDDAIKRSEVLRFLDDYQSGLIHKMIYKKQAS